MTKFLREAFIPAVNRMGIDGVGVFEPEEGGMFYVLLRHPSLEVLASIDQTLLLDAEFARTAADFLDRPVSPTLRFC